MTSGIGFQGGRSRCYTFWQDYFDCYASAEHPKQCSLQLENYIECLHHRKEKARVARVRDEWAKQQKSGKMSQDTKVVLSNPEGALTVSRLGFIDGSAKQSDKSK